MEKGDEILIINLMKEFIDNNMKEKQKKLDWKSCLNKRRSFLYLILQQI